MVEAGSTERESHAPSSGLPQIVLTKTIPPSANRLRIERGRLLLILRQAASRRLILLKAPAGYGKTTLAVDWYEDLRRSGAIVAWLSVDEDDNEPSAFAYHIARTLHRAAPELGQPAIDLLAETKLIASRNVVSAALNAVAESDDEVYLFLDDYHLISDSRSHEITAFLLRYAPSNFHLVVMSRTEPALSISRLQLSDDVAEIDVASLRFTLEETSQFLRAEFAPRLASADVEKLHEATEGWPAALQLARITVRNSPDLARTIRSFSGASRKISAYIEDTLATQADEIVGFLTRTAILDRLQGPLCQAVTGIARSAELLESLNHEQLLLVTLDEHEGWYRYHHLMSDYLVDRLRTRAPEMIPELHRRAYRWFASQDMWSDAVRHALAARDLDQALQYVEQCAMAMVVHGDTLTLLSWERKLPAELMSGQLEVKLALAWGFILVTRLAEGAALLAQIEAVADKERTPDLWWRCQVTRGALLAVSDDCNGALAVTTACRDKIDFDPFHLNSIYNVLRYCYWRLADFDAFYALPKPDIADGESTYMLAEQYRLCLCGMVSAQRLQFSEALSLYAESRRLIERYAGARSASAAIPTSLAAILRYETGDVGEAEVSVLDELALIETTVFHNAFMSGYLVLARAAFLRDDLERALAVLDRGVQLAQERGWVYMAAAFLVERVRFAGPRAVPGGLREIIDGLAESRSVDRGSPVHSWPNVDMAVTVSEALVALAGSQADLAARLLEPVYVGLRIDNRLEALRVGRDLAIAHYNAGNLGEATRIASEVVGSAGAPGAISFALERRAEFTPILSSVLKSSIGPDVRRHAELLLSRCRQREGADGDSNTAELVKQVLTDRERSIVQFIAGGQSNKQIARTLGVTPETVKTHLKRIFVKLSAESRAQAVARAQSLGLLRTVDVH